jgi:hypothetical protein
VSGDGPATAPGPAGSPAAAVAWWRRGIEAPPREQPFGALLIVLAAAAFASLVLLPPGRTFELVGVLAAVAILGWLARSEQAFHLGLFLGLTLAATKLPLEPWPLPMAAGIAAYLALTLPLAALRGGLRWARVGRLGRDVVWLVAASVVVASVALVVWFELAQPNVDDLLRELPQVPTWQLVGLALLFSMLNATVEEAIFRGMLLQAFDGAFGPGWTAVVLQAVTFGVLHLYGFPRGWLGVGLATIYGLMTGVLRRRSGGLLAPWLGHVAVDVAIVAILVLRA